jgi:CCR4-NOT transcriptional regulation complex NOT5 subunit
MVSQVGNVSILAVIACQGLSTPDIMGCFTATSPAIGCPTSTPSHTLALVATTLPCSHNVAASQNTRAKSTLDAIKSLVENDGDPNTKVAIRDIALNDTSVSTTCDVDAAGPTIGSIGGVGTMEGVLTTSDNKND